MHGRLLALLATVALLPGCAIALTADAGLGGGRAQLETDPNSDGVAPQPLTGRHNMATESYDLGLVVHTYFPRDYALVMGLGLRLEHWENQVATRTLDVPSKSDGDQGIVDALVGGYGDGGGWLVRLSADVIGAGGAEIGLVHFFNQPPKLMGEYVELFGSSLDVPVSDEFRAGRQVQEHVEWIGIRAGFFLDYAPCDFHFVCGQ